ncbi:hypothetical protein ACGE24_07915 [Corynebacterium kroppenstedtii]|uniref:hypothetical protein n=1 Tax=Corynebacterium sp. PCR 32 TaxID=3351342 RepID=UPI0030B44BF8
MRNLTIFFFGALSVVLAFLLTLYGYRSAAIVFLIFAAADFTLIFWTNEDRYYTGEHVVANRWVDTISVWVGALFIAIFDNWGGLVLFVCPGWTLATPLRHAIIKRREGEKPPRLPR